MTKSLLVLEDLSKDNIGNSEIAKYKLEQIHSFNQEIEKSKIGIQAFKTLVNEILEKCEPNFTNILNNKLETIIYKWTVIVGQAKSLNNKYEGAVKKNDDVGIPFLIKK